jgi:hypothetical protein
MMKGAGHVNAGFPGQANSLSKITSYGNLYFGDVPYPPILGWRFEKKSKGNNFVAFEQGPPKCNFQFTLSPVGAAGGVVSEFPCNG